MSLARRWALSAVFLVATAACGTPLPHSDQVVAGNQGGGSGGSSGLGDVGTTGGTTGSGVGTSSGSSSLGGSAGGFAGGRAKGGSTGSAGTTGAGSLGSAGTSNSGGSSSSSGSATTNVVGVTATSITVGIVYSVNSQAAANAIGSKLNTGDPLAEQKVIIKDINAHGGIGGRKLLYVGHPVDATSAEPYSTQASEECADFTQDHHVFAILDDLFGEDIRACANKAGAVQVGDSAQSFSSSATFQKYPYLALPGSVRQDRIAAAWTPALSAQGYFGKWDFNTGKPGALPVKVGILSFDDAADVYAVEHILRPALKAAGYPSEAVKVAYPQGTADNGSTVSAIQSAVLQFRSDNVTHFLPLDEAAGLSLYFGKNASSQHYYPRYGLNTGDGMQTLIDSGLMPRDQLNGAAGYGWEPVLDIDSSHDSDTGPYSNAARRHCIAIMKAGNINISGSPATRGALEYCDQYAFFKAAMEAGGPAASRDSFLRGVNSLNNSFPAATTFRTHLDSSHHDGVSSYRLFAYNQPCTCFLYSSDVKPLP